MPMRLGRTRAHLRRRGGPCCGSCRRSGRRSQGIASGIKTTSARLAAPLLFRQMFPNWFAGVTFGLFTRWLHRWALIAGWLVGMVYGSYEAYGVSTPTIQQVAGAIATIPTIGSNGYIGLTALVINLIVAMVGTLTLRLMPGSAYADQTAPDDYLVDAGGAVRIGMSTSLIRAFERRRPSPHRLRWGSGPPSRRRQPGRPSLPSPCPSIPR